VSIDVGARRAAPVIPRSATRATDHGYVVYVVDGSTATEKVVKLGMNTKDGQVEIRSGLEAGELLVVRGVESMTNGAKVNANKVDSMDPAAPETPLDPKSAQPDSRSALATPAGSAAPGHRRPKGSGAEP
jgi:hypothetical protein